MIQIIWCFLLGLVSAEGMGREFQILRHDTNRVEMCISNYATFGLNETGMSPGCWWPAGSSHYYIYGAGLWFGTIDSLTGDTLVTTGFDPHDGSSEYAPGLQGMNFSHPCAIIYMHPYSWPPPGDTLPMAPQEVVSHQDSWCCFNDSDSVYHHTPEGRPIGIEGFQTVYVWDLPLLEDVIFFVFEVKNVSGHTLFHCYSGVCINCEIGGLLDANDRCSGIVEREYIISGDTITVDNFAYQWQEVEEPGTPPWFPGTIGLDLLQTPFDLVVGMDKDGDGILDQYERDSAYYVNNLPQYLWDTDNDGVPDWRDPSQWPNFGLTALKRLFLNFDPDTDPERYAVLAGYNFVTGEYQPFDTIPGDPDDQRFIISSGPFNLPPDSTVILIFTVVFADWYDIFAAPDTALALIDQWAEDYYNMYWHLYTGIEENQELRISKCEMRILPNPVSNIGLISLSLPAATGVSLKLYNTLGQLVETVYDGFSPAGVHESILNTRNLPQGTYFLVLETPEVRQERSFVLVR